jgi:hypothetical protein
MNFLSNFCDSKINLKSKIFLSQLSSMVRVLFTLGAVTQSCRHLGQHHLPHQWWGPPPTSTKKVPPSPPNSIVEKLCPRIANYVRNKSSDNIMTSMPCKFTLRIPPVGVTRYALQGCMPCWWAQCLITIRWLSLNLVIFFANQFCHFLKQ